MDDVAELVGLRGETTLAILLGAHQYPLNPKLDSAAFLESAEAFKNYLLNDLKLPDSNLLNLFNCDLSAGDHGETVMAFLGKNASRGTDLLLYYVGHGHLDGAQNYALAIRKTRVGTGEQIFSSSYPVTTLAQDLGQAKARMRIILIIDACFAANAFTAFQSDTGTIHFNQKWQAALGSGGMKGTLQGQSSVTRGVALLAAVNAHDAALSTSGSGMTRFAEALFSVLRDGDNEEAELLNLEAVCRAAKRLLAHTRGPIPEVHNPDQSKGSVSHLPLFPNAKFKQPNVAAIADAQPELPLEAPLTPLKLPGLSALQSRAPQTPAVNEVPPLEPTPQNAQPLTEPPADIGPSNVAEPADAQPELPLERPLAPNTPAVNEVRPLGPAPQNAQPLTEPPADRGSIAILVSRVPRTRKLGLFFVAGSLVFTAILLIRWCSSDISKNSPDGLASSPPTSKRSAPRTPPNRCVLWGDGKSLEGRELNCTVGNRRAVIALHGQLSLGIGSPPTTPGTFDLNSKITLTARNQSGDVLLTRHLEARRRAKLVDGNEFAYLEFGQVAILEEEALRALSTQIASFKVDEVSSSVNGDAVETQTRFCKKSAADCRTFELWVESLHDKPEWKDAQACWARVNAESEKPMCLKAAGEVAGLEFGPGWKWSLEQSTLEFKKDAAERCLSFLPYSRGFVGSGIGSCRLSSPPNYYERWIEVNEPSAAPDGGGLGE